MSVRFFEDFEPGPTYELGCYTIDVTDITDFANQWDPQRFHTNPELARTSPYGGLIVSGWHTAAIFMRLYVEHLLAESSCVGSAGVDELRWLVPVRPDDTLTATVRIETVRPSRTHPDRGTLRPFCELRNQHNHIVLRMYLNTILLRRPHLPAEPTTDRTPAHDVVLRTHVPTWGSRCEESAEAVGSNYDRAPNPKL